MRIVSEEVQVTEVSAFATCTCSCSQPGGSSCTTSGSSTTTTTCSTTSSALLTGLRGGLEEIDGLAGVFGGRVGRRVGRSGGRWISRWCCCCLRRLGCSWSLLFLRVFRNALHWVKTRTPKNRAEKAHTQKIFDCTVRVEIGGSHGAVDICAGKSHGLHLTNYRLALGTHKKS